MKVDLSRAALDRTEVAYVAGAKRAYAAAWARVRAALPRSQSQTGGTHGDLNDPLVRRAIAETLRQGLEQAAREAVAVLVTGAYVSKAAGPWAGGEKDPWAGWAGTGVPPVDPEALFARYTANLDGVGGVKGMSDTALSDLERAIQDFYADPEMSMTDLEARLAPYFSDWKATQVGITETTRIATEDRRMVADQLGVTTGTFDTSEDEDVCEECDPLDQTTVDLSDDSSMPPIHPGCRCGVSLDVSTDDGENADIEGE